MAGQSRYWRISFLLALAICACLVLTVFPLSHNFSIMRPEFMCLLVIYWVLNVPQQLGVMFAWTVGFTQDMIEGSVWGAHALALTIIAYICLLSWQRIRSYPIWQQALWVFVLAGTHQVVVSWVQGMAGYHSPTHQILLPTLTSALIWPLFSLVFLRLRLRMRVMA